MKAAKMYGFRTKLALAALLALAAVPVQASGVGGAATDTPSSGSDSLIGGTSITGEKVIVSDSVIVSDNNISVNKTFNGVNVGYGRGGSAVLDSVTGATNDAATFNSDRHAMPLQLESMVLGALGLQ